MEGADQFAVFQQRFGQGVLAGAGLEFGDEQRGRDVALFEGAGDADKVVPVLVDELDLGVMFQKRAGPWPLLIVAGRTGPPELCFGQLRDPGRQAETDQVEQGEGGQGLAVAVGGVLDDRQLGGVAEDPSDTILPQSVISPEIVPKGEPMAGSVTPGTAALWLGNDSHGLVFAMDLGGNVLAETAEMDVTGIAFDGARLFFASGFKAAGATSTALTIHDKSTGAQIGGPFSMPSYPGSPEDLAFDTDGNLWRVNSGDASPQPQLVKIDPNPAGGVLSSTTFDLSPDENPALTLAYGITYNRDDDVLYVSYGDFLGNIGAVHKVDPHAAVPDIAGVLFRKDGPAGPDAFVMGGLAYQPGTGTLSGKGTLWAGGTGFVRHMALDGTVLAIVTRPQSARPVPAAGFVDGLEFVSGA